MYEKTESNNKETQNETIDNDWTDIDLNDDAATEEKRQADADTVEAVEQPSEAETDLTEGPECTETATPDPIPLKTPSNATEDMQHTKRKHDSGKIDLKNLVCSAIIFGFIGGGMMLGMNAMMLKTLHQSYDTAVALLDKSEPKITQAATVTSTTTETNDIPAIVEAAMPSVVAINSKMTVTSTDWFFGTQKYEATGAGSGIIVGENDEELLIATNNHVVSDSEEMTVTFIDGEQVQANIKGTDPDIDLAVLAVSLNDIPDLTKTQIKVANLGDSDALRLGEGVVAIGNALGEGQSVTVGYVSALNKKVKDYSEDHTFIQVDAAINPGNSGGALLNSKGEVIGINSAKIATTDVEGVGYAIPISDAKEIINNLMNMKTKVEVPEDKQGYLGIQMQNVDSKMAQMYDMPEGVYIYKIVDGTGAKESELRERDIILKLNGESVRSGEDLKKLLTYYEAGTEVTFTIKRLENGEYTEKEIKVTLGNKPKESAKEETEPSQKDEQKTADDTDDVFENFTKEFPELWQFSPFAK